MNHCSHSQINKFSLPVAVLTTRPMNSHYRSLFSLPDQWILTTGRCSHYQINEFSRHCSRKYSIVLFYYWISFGYTNLSKNDVPASLLPIWSTEISTQNLHKPILFSNFIIINLKKNLLASLGVLHRAVLELRIFCQAYFQHSVGTYCTWAASCQNHPLCCFRDLQKDKERFLPVNARRVLRRLFQGICSNNNDGFHFRRGDESRLITTRGIQGHSSLRPVTSFPEILLEYWNARFNVLSRLGKLDCLARRLCSETLAICKRTTYGPQWAAINGNILSILCIWWIQTAHP